MASLGLPGRGLWRRPTAALLAATIPLVLIVLPVIVEERFLTRKLHGYEEYTHRVRCRLLPFVW